jgi:Flavodoxin
VPCRIALLQVRLEVEVSQMHTVIVYESPFGNTHKIAEAIAEGIRTRQPDAEVACVPVAEATAALIRGADLLIVGGPTHMRGMSSGMSRKKGVEGEQKKAPDLHVEPGFDGPGLRDWFHGLDRPAGSSSAAAFDTRAGIRMAGGAAPGIARRLRHHGYRVLATEGYIIDDTQGPLHAGELDRARDWGASLSRRLAA